jgi:putative membrane protein
MKRIWTLSTVAFLAAFAMTTGASAQTQNPQQTQGAQPSLQQQDPRGAPAPGNLQPSQTPAPAGADRRFSFNAGAAGAAMQAQRSPDAELAACLIIDNELEVAAGQIAQQRAQSDDIKQFASQMVQQHGEMIQKLQRFAGSSVAASGAANPSTATATNTVAAPNAAGQPQANRGQDVQGQLPLDHVALKRELGDLCKQTMQRELGQKSGAEFDKCYMGQQIGAHLHAIDAMHVAQNHASPEFRTALGEGIQAAETHLQHAKDITKKLEGPSSGSSSNTSNR